MFFNNHKAHALWFFCIFAFANHEMCPCKSVCMRILNIFFFFYPYLLTKTNHNYEENLPLLGCVIQFDLYDSLCPDR